MAQEFTIKSQQIEDKINQLLPTQGGFQPGVDFSASTMVIPIVDLTETAEGSNLRQDLQSSLSLNSCTSFSVTNTTSTIINTTGYFRVFSNNIVLATTGNKDIEYNITDGFTTKKLIQYRGNATSSVIQQYQLDVIVFLQAGDSLSVTSDTSCTAVGTTRQIADINGNLINP